MHENQRVAIIGAGIGGLVLALSLHAKGITQITVYEQAPRFDDEAGGAIGMYANGMRVLRDISPQLLQDVRQQGYKYLNRVWMRHDGTIVAKA